MKNHAGLFAVFCVTLFFCGWLAGWHTRAAVVPSPEASPKAEAAPVRPTNPPFTMVRVYCTDTNALITNDGRPTRFHMKRGGVEDPWTELDRGWAYSFHAGSSEARNNSVTVECEATR